MNTESETPKTLVAKLAEVMGNVTRVAKTGRNTFFQYDYVTESDLTEEIRPKLAAAGIMMVPTITKHTRTESTNQKGNRTFFTDVDIVWTLTDGGEQTLQILMPGTAEDSSDKGLYKAITGSEKYVLKNLFLISTGDDPEQDGEHERHGATALPQPPRAYQEAKQAQLAAAEASASDSELTGALGPVKANKEGTAWFMSINGVGTRPGESVWTRDKDLATSLVKSQGTDIVAHLRSKKPGSYQIISFVPANE